jgi:hypothetical protein
MKPTQRRAVLALLFVGLLLAATAVAQQVLEFHPISGDSVSSITVGPGVVKVVTKTGRTVTVTGDSGKQGAIPASPEAPEPPEPPDLHVNHSHDIVRFGGSIHVNPDEVITGNVVAIGGSVRVEGQVQGDVVAIGGPITLEPQARVDGDVVSVGGEVHRSSGSIVGGQVVTTGRIPGGMLFAVPVLGLVGHAVKAMAILVAMLFLMLVAWALVSWLPEQSRASLAALRERPAHALGLGLVAWMLILPSLIALVLVVVILCITIIGIPLALLVLLGYGVAVAALGFWGYAVGAAALGERVAKGLRREAGTVTRAALWGVGTLGVLIAVGHLFRGLGLLGGWAGGLLEFVGRVVAVIVLTMGAGALLLTQVAGGAASRWWSRARGRGAPAPQAAAAPAPGGGVTGPGSGAAPV